MNKLNNKQLLKVTFSIFFMLTSLIAVLITHKTETVSELSIYSSISSFIWIAVVGAIFFGVCTVVISSVYDEKYPDLWKLGLLLILLINFIVIFLPFLRGYVFPEAGDHLTHIGLVKYITQSGIISKDNFYPITHILITQISLILGTSITSISMFISPLFYCLFILYTYLLCREIMPTQPAKLSVLASTVLSCYYFSKIFPMGFAFITFPLVFYLSFKQFKAKSVSITLCLVVISLFLIFTHPVAASLLILTLVLIEHCKPFSDLFLGYKINRGFLLNYFKTVSPTLYLLIGVVLISWLWNFYLVWNFSVLSFASWFSGELLTKPITSEASYNFQRLGFNFIDILVLFLKIYGQVFIYFILSVIISISILKKRIPLNEQNMVMIFLYICFFVPSIAVWLVDCIRPLTALTSGRMQHLVSSLFPPLVGLALYHIEIITIGAIKKYPGNLSIVLSPKSYIIGRKSMKCITIIFILSICSLLALFSYYDSPFIYKANDAMSQSEVVGIQWLLDTGNPNTNIIGAGVAIPFRIADATWGVNQKNRSVWDDYVIAHFGYDTNEYLIDSVKSPRYLILRPKYILKYYQDLYPTISKYNKNDFVNLDSDTSISLVYESNEINVWVL